MKRVATLLLALAGQASAMEDAFFDAWWAGGQTSAATGWTPAELGTQVFRWYDMTAGQYMLDTNGLPLTGNGYPTQLTDRSSYNVPLQIMSTTNISLWEATFTNGIGALRVGLGAAPYFGPGDVESEIGTLYQTALIIVSPTSVITDASAPKYPFLSTNNSAPGRATMLLGAGSVSWTSERSVLYSTIATSVRGFANNTNNLPAAPSVHVLVIAGTNEADVVYSIDGAVHGTQKSSTNPGHFTTNNYPARWNSMGASAQGAVYVLEQVVIRTNLDAAARQKLEGYAAWKVGRQGALPADHPYKAAPP